MKAKDIKRYQKMKQDAPRLGDRTSIHCIILYPYISLCILMHPSYSRHTSTIHSDVCGSASELLWRPGGGNKRGGKGGDMRRHESRPDPPFDALILIIRASYSGWGWAGSSMFLGLVPRFLGLVPSCPIWFLGSLTRILCLSLFRSALS